MHLGRDRQILLIKMTHDADPQAPDVAGQGRAIVGDRRSALAGSFGSCPASACSMIAQSSTVQVIGPAWSKVKELADAGPADQPIGRLQPDDAA